MSSTGKALRILVVSVSDSMGILRKMSMTEHWKFPMDYGL